MKRLSSKLYFIIPFVLLVSCSTDAPIEPFPEPKQHPQPIIDYRDAFTGTYYCHRLCTFWSISQPQTDTVFNGYINITVSKLKGSANKLIVHKDTIPVDSSGSFSGFYEPPGFKNYYINFRSDSLFLNTFSGGLGGGTSCKVTGHK
jgi:hypothetical protein